MRFSRYRRKSGMPSPAKLLEKVEAAPDAKTDEEWAKEIERRSAEALNPAWQGRTWEEVRGAAEQSLRASRGR